MQAAVEAIHNTQFDQFTSENTATHSSIELIFCTMLWFEVEVRGPVSFSCRCKCGFRGLWILGMVHAARAKTVL